jgi:hypothetical protein
VQKARRPGRPASTRQDQLENRVKNLLEEQQKGFCEFHSGQLCVFMLTICHRRSGHDQRDECARPESMGGRMVVAVLGALDETDA